MFSMNDICNFLSGIQLRSQVNGFFVVFHFTEKEEPRQELFMDVYVELESISGVEIALKRNQETFSCSASSSKLGLMTTHTQAARDPCCPPPDHYAATRRDYCADIAAVRNEEIFCAKNIGVKICGANPGLRLPAIVILNRLIATPTAGGQASLLAFTQMPPSLLLRNFPQFFTKLEARLKGGGAGVHPQKPSQWASYYFDDTGGSYSTLEDHLDMVFTRVKGKAGLGPMNRGRASSGSSGGGGDCDEESALADDLLVLLSSLVTLWSSLLCKQMAIGQSPAGGDGAGGGSAVGAASQDGNRLLMMSMEFIGRQIQFYHILHNFEILHV